MARLGIPNNQSHEFYRMVEHFKSGDDPEQVCRLCKKDADCEACRFNASKEAGDPWTTRGPAKGRSGHVTKSGHYHYIHQGG